MSDRSGLVTAVEAGAREQVFPILDHRPNTVRCPDGAARNPYLIYLATLGGDEARRAMGRCLDRIAALWATQAGMFLPDPAGLHFPWSELRYQHTAAIRALLLDQRTKTGRPWSPAYRNKHLAALRKILEHAWLLGGLEAEDYHRARQVKDVPGMRLPPGRSLSPAERAAMTGACLDGTLAGVRDAALLAVVYSTGCRRAEAATADRENYDPGGRALRIIGKGNKQREVYLTVSAAAQLGQWLTAAPGKYGPLFCPVTRWEHVERRHMTPDAVGKVVVRRARQAGVPDVSAHDLRRTFIGDLLDAGVDLATVKQLVGHASASTTAAYDRRGARARRAAVDKLEQEGP